MCSQNPREMYDARLTQEQQYTKFPKKITELRTILKVVIAFFNIKYLINKLNKIIINYKMINYRIIKYKKMNYIMINYKMIKYKMINYRMINYKMIIKFSSLS